MELKDIIEEYTTKLEEDWTTAGPKEIITETAQIVAREVIRKVREGTKNMMYSEFMKDSPAKHQNDALLKVLIHLQSLENELSAEVLSK
jgi:hypothetical protein